MEDSNHAIVPLNDNALVDDTTNTTATAANLQPCSGGNEDAAATAYTQTQMQDNMLMQEVGEGESGITWNDSKEVAAAANGTAADPITGGDEATPTMGGMKIAQRTQMSGEGQMWPVGRVPWPLRWKMERRRGKQKEKL